MTSKKGPPRKKPTRKAPQKRKAASRKKKKKSVPSIRRRLLKYAAVGSGLCILALFALFGAVYIGLFGKLPDGETLRGLKNADASELYSADGELLGKYYIENRSSIAYDEIPEFVIQALVATEDSRFFNHEGIDLYSIPRVVVKSIILGDRSAGGGSTISQQLIKNLFGRTDHGALSMPVNKLKENVTALKLEEVYTKEEIITLYLNTVSFGENVYGIKAASQRFFGKTPDRLEVPEAAVLIGMLKANTSYNPRLHPEAAKERRNTVLALMVKEGFLDPEDLRQLSETPIALRYSKKEGRDAPAPYFHAFAEKEVRRILEKAGSEHDLYRSGLIIRTTLHAKLQRYAQEALREQMEKLQASFDRHRDGALPVGINDEFLWKEARKSVRYKRLKTYGRSEEDIHRIFTTPVPMMRFSYAGPERVEMSPLDSVAYHQMILHAGFIVTDPENGHVLAYAGGVDFSRFPHDHVQSARQSGSTFKPFVYGAALENGFSPCDYIENEKIIFAEHDNWSPENADGKYGGEYSLRGGLAYSVNTVTARLIAETGPEPVLDFAKRAGIEADLPKVPAVSLGVADIPLSELTAAYAIFANGGMRIAPTYITSVETREGEIIYRAPESAPVRATDRETALTLLHMLEAVVDSGTARSVRSIYGVRMPLGGKTGTTQNNADGRFMAVTPGMVCGAWVGGASPLVRFRTTALGQGARTALPIVASFLRKAETDPGLREFTGRARPEISARIRYESFCPLYRSAEDNKLFKSLYDRDERQQRRELRREAREERREERKKKGGWMRRLLDKLKKDDRGSKN